MRLNSDSEKSIVGTEIFSVDASCDGKYFTKENFWLCVTSPDKYQMTILLMFVSATAVRRLGSYDISRVLFSRGS